VKNIDELAIMLGVRKGSKGYSLSQLLLATNARIDKIINDNVKPTTQLSDSKSKRKAKK